jgi:hypothetical protein
MSLVHGYDAMPEVNDQTLSETETTKKNIEHML